ncbi:MAG: HD family hydrolase [Salinarimonadaceae bacterium]|nr:MAG: HD family hydrolase [Salinarimonadaceae bacterium]
MLSGRRLDLLDPSPVDVELEDIAHGLARVARWNGQTRGEHIFSVAQHSLLVEAMADTMASGITRAERLSILLHDAPEYVIGDMISPFKAVIGEAYKGVEERLLAAIRLHFGLSAKPSRALATLTKRADGAAAHHEAVILAGFSVAEARVFFGEPRPLSDSARALLDPMPVGRAQALYHDRVLTLHEAGPLRDR